MKIAYFVNSFNSINWGGQATSNGVKYLIQKNYPNAEFVPLDLPKLPFKKIKFLRSLFEKGLYNALINDNKTNVIKYLKKFNINEDFFNGYSHICFNGESAIHSKSGHLVVLMGMLYLAKLKGLYVASINQTIDLKNSEKLEKLVKKIYSNVDYLSVRESVSYDYAKNDLKLDNINLIPDAAYAIPHLDNESINDRVIKYYLPENFIAIAGSSFLKRDKKSLLLISNILEYIRRKFPSIKLIFLANAKTDIWIAHKLQSKYNFKIIQPPVKYLDSMAIISKANMVIGGRQHINIFAYKYSVPYLPFGANTLKNIGVSKLQKYPILPLEWNCTYEEFSEKIDELNSCNILFNKIKIQNFNIFKINT